MKIEIKKLPTTNLIYHDEMNNIFLSAYGNITIFAKKANNPYITLSSKSGLSILYKNKRKIFPYENKNQTTEPSKNNTGC